MSTLEPLAGTAATLPWFAWEPLTPGNGLTLAALLIAVYGLWLMRRAATARDRQVDALTRMLDERTAILVAGMQAVTRGLETVIERTAPGAGGESV